MDRREQIRRPAQILDGEVEEQILGGDQAVALRANIGIIGGAMCHGVVEDRRVRCQAGDRERVDIMLQRTVIEQATGDVVEPQALTEMLQRRGRTLLRHAPCGGEGRAGHSLTRRVFHRQHL